MKVFLPVLVIAVGVRVLLSILFIPHLSNGQQLTLTTTLLSDPVQAGRFEHLTVWYPNGFSSVPLFVTILSPSTLHYGQTVTLTGKAQFLEKIASNQSSRVIDDKKLSMAMYLPKIEARNDENNVFLSISFFLRHVLQKFYEKLFSQEDAALLIGIVLGVKGSFSKDFQQALQLSGVTHVIAASGMNVTMVAGFFTGIFSQFLKRQWAVVCTISILIFYCVISGLQPSILRATIMLIFMLIGQLFGRQYTPLYGLFLAAGSMLLVSPTLLWDIGFQLSFASTLGIMYIKPLVPELPLIGEDIATTISAQLATLPILLGSFGTYGVLSILVNALVLWTVPPLMILGGVGGLVGLVIEPVGRLILFFCLPFLWYFGKIVLFFGTLNWHFTVPAFPLVMTMGYYMVLGSIVWILSQRRSKLECKS